eukprot:TRINITY_DN10581_c0_g1_i5.p1 TRINITY_DN10581_c0_g1~~TRINITY_DN10581_c0_g1_i5.p1  ORF type:complete len:252 (-),score=74.58 TRINITY_DN10581_c0_g1_i5:391-1146(-)
MLNDPALGEHLDTDWETANEEAIEEQMKAIISKQEVPENLSDVTFDIKGKQQLEQELAQLIPKINEVNAVCQQLGKVRFYYYPTVLVKSKVKPMEYAVFVRLYTNRAQNLFKRVSIEDFIEKYYVIKEKFESYLEGSEVKAKESVAEEIRIFGPKVKVEWKLIGQANIYTDSIANLLDIQNEQTPAIDSNGNVNGELRYSIIPKYFENGEEQKLVQFDGIEQLEGKVLQVTLRIHSLYGLQPKYTSEIICR